MKLTPSSSSYGYSSMAKSSDSFPECTCKLRVEMKTSRTQLNPGRRFLRCSNKEKQCDFFEWVDPEVNPRMEDHDEKLNFWIGECYRLQKYVEEDVKRIRSLENEVKILRMENAKRKNFSMQTMGVCVEVIVVIWLVLQVCV